MPTDIESDQETSIDLLELINNPEVSDVVFLCEDGVQVHACSMLLAARSPYFKKKLLYSTRKLKESFAMPKVTSSAMIIIMKFIYTGLSADDIFEKEFLGGGGSSWTDSKGRAEISSKEKCEFLNLNWKLLLKVVDAARIFELGRLRDEILNRVRTVLPSGGYHTYTEDTLNQIARTFSAVCEYSKVWMAGREGYFIEEACLSMVKILISHDLSPATLFHLSEEAFLYYLVDSLSPAGEEISEWSLNEYLRLRAILTWCAVQAANGVVFAENFDRTCLPGPDIALTFLGSSEGSRQEYPKPAFDFRRGRTGLVKKVSKKALKPLLDWVNFACIHPELLLRVIAPLDIIEPLELTMVLGLQAMKSSRRLRKNANIPNVWHLLNPMGEVCRKPTSDNLTLTVTVRRELQQVKVKAIAGIQMLSSEDCEWEIVATPHGLVGQRDMAGFEVGIYRLQPGEAFGQNQDSRTWLSDDSRGSAMKICGDLQSAEFRHKQSNFFWKLEQGSQFKWNSPITVKLNRIARTCSFSYAGSFINLRMNGVKDGLVYPAIDFTLRGPGHYLLRPYYDFLTVNIRTLSGFNNAAVYVDPELLIKSCV